MDSGWFVRKTYEDVYHLVVVMQSDGRKIARSDRSWAGWSWRRK